MLENPMFHDYGWGYNNDSYEVGKCPNCKTEIYSGDYVFRDFANDDYFCSGECYLDYYSEFIKIKPANKEMICKECGEIIKAGEEYIEFYDDIFCCLDCIVNNSGKYVDAE